MKKKANKTKFFTISFMTNIYKQYITYLVQLEKKLYFSQKNLILEKHHILPLHDGGKKDGPIVRCSSKNHTLAHYYRYLAYDQFGDKVAYTMRQGCKISLKEMALLAVQKLQREKISFYNSEWQSVQGKKPKKKQKHKNKFINVKN